MTLSWFSHGRQGKALPVLHQTGPSLSYSAIMESLHDFSLSCTMQYLRQSWSLYSQLPDSRIWSLSILHIPISIFHFFSQHRTQTAMTSSMCCRLVLPVNPHLTSLPSSPAMLTPCEKLGTPFAHGHPPFLSVVFRTPCLISRNSKNGRDSFKYTVLLFKLKKIQQFTSSVLISAFYY